MGKKVVKKSAKKSNLAKKVKKACKFCKENINIVKGKKKLIVVKSHKHLKAKVHHKKAAKKSAKKIIKKVTLKLKAVKKTLKVALKSNDVKKIAKAKKAVKVVVKKVVKAKKAAKVVIKKASKKVT